MKSSRIFDRRVGNIVASLGLLLGVVAPAALPVFASADQLSSRSIEMSSSLKSDTTVTYELKFTANSAFQSAVVDFCGNSPIIGDTCNAPSGMSTSGAATTYAGLGATDVSSSSANHLIIDGDGTAAGPGAVDITITGITNPSGTGLTNGTFYARIYTFATDNATAYNTVHLDDGGVALAVTDGIGVQATVKESMTFCVAGGTNATGDQSGTGELAATGPSAGCGTYNGTDNTGGTGSTGVGAPNLVLGDGGSPSILESGATDTGFDWAQISTNASSGAVVRLKDSNNCGGLSKNNGTTCEIAAAGDAATSLTGKGLFGLTLSDEGAAATAPTVVGDPGQIVPAAPYDDGTDFGFDNTTSGNTVAGTYGSKIFDTNGAPALNRNIKLTFGASASSLTPAGIYKAVLNLIATGTF